MITPRGRVYCAGGENKKIGAACWRPRLCKGFVICLEVIVEAEAEVAELAAKRLGVEVGTEIEVVGVLDVFVAIDINVFPNVGSVDKGESQEVDVEVGRETVVELVVETGDDREGDTVDIIVAGVGGVVSPEENVFDLGVEFVDFLFTIKGERELSLAEEGEALYRTEVVAQVGGNGKAALRGFLPAFKILIGTIQQCPRGVIRSGAAFDAKGETDLHIVVELVADFGHDAIAGGSHCSAVEGGLVVFGRVVDASVIDVSAVIEVAELASDYELCVGSKSECCENEG